MSKYQIYDREKAKIQKTGNPKLVGGRYLVEMANAYFHNEYVGVRDMQNPQSPLIVAWLPNSFHEKAGSAEYPKTAEQLFNYLSTAERCKKFMKGEVTRVRVGSALGDRFGTNALYKSY